LEPPTAVVIFSVSKFVSHELKV